MEDLTPKQMQEFVDQLGQCVYCQRHWESAPEWAEHISTEHPGVWVELSAEVP